MHTVIITSDKLSEQLNEYKFLFTPFVDNDEISFCTWNESGVDIKTSVPDLYKTIKGRYEWRVVIIINPFNTEDENGRLLYDERNPYDFYSNYGMDNHIADSDIPLIRLTHMLAGYPTLGVKEFDKAYTYFNQQGLEVIRKEEDITKEELQELAEQYGKGLRITYIEKDYSEEEKKLHTSLSKKYDFEDARPTEIVLITTRKKLVEDTKQTVRRFWQNNLETESSNFWKRNNYPNTCRFLCCDISNKENSRYLKELSSFWIAILTVSINLISPSSLQAYRLYNLSVIISKQELELVINGHLSKLKAALDSVKERMKLKSTYTFDQQAELVMNQVVPVIFDNINMERLFVDSKKIGLTKDYPTDDSLNWNHNYMKSKQNFDTFLKAPRRAISVATEYVRERTDNFIGDEYVLDKFQMADLADMIETVEADIFSLNTKTAFDINNIKEEMNSHNKKIRKHINSRLNTKTVVISGLIAVLLYMAGYLPYLFNSTKSSITVFLCSLLLVIVCMFSVAFGGIVALFSLRQKLRRKVEEYNNSISAIVSKINSSAKKFESYLTNVCTYMKAQAILKGVKMNQGSSTSIRFLLKIHNLSLKAAIEQEEKWSSAFNTALKLEPLTNCSLFFNPEIPPKDNSIYRLEISDELRIPINDSGDMIKAPYKFVSRLLIEREELYENTKGGLETWN